MMSMETKSIKIKHKGEEKEIAVVVPETIAEAVGILGEGKLLQAARVWAIREAKRAAVRTRPRKRWLKLDLTSETDLALLKRLAAQAQ